MATLHITNGDSAAEGLKQAQLGGDVLPWRDVLHDGPVPASPTWADFVAERSRFLASRGAGSFEDIARSFAGRDDQLDALTARDDVALWFEPDLYDQLQLCEVLARFAERDAAERPQLSIVPADCLLGTLSPAAFAPLFEHRRPLGTDDVMLGASVWKEITCPDPTGIAAAARRVADEQPSQRYAASDTSTLPHLGAALIRWLEQLPSFVNGLNRSEQQICDVLRHGPCTVLDTYRRSHHDVEEWIWLGDWSFAWYVQQLAAAETPIVTCAGDSPMDATDVRDIMQNFATAHIQLTTFGHEVQQQRADAIDMNGIDRWFGGAHLLSADHWRWDAQTKLVVSRRSERRHRPRE